MMVISERGISLIKAFEGCSLTAYPDSGGVWTIGYGHTNGVTPGQTITQEEADRFLADDLAHFATGVGALVKVPLSQHQTDALVALAYNIGLHAFEHSTLLRLLNAGDLPGAASQFGVWNRVGTRIFPGLVRRRAAEAALFRSDVS